uniref:Uncharacterized protein n=1 Tax=Trichuris muris TaxID=70415 RepID=A0A5S6R1I4_TRIMR
MLGALCFLLVLGVFVDAQFYNDVVMQRLREIQKEDEDVMQELRMNVNPPYAFPVSSPLRDSATHILTVSALLNPDPKIVQIYLMADGSLSFFNLEFRFDPLSFTMYSDLLERGSRSETTLVKNLEYQDTQYFYCMIVMNPEQWQVYYADRWYVGRVNPPPQTTLIKHIYLFGDCQNATITLMSPYGNKKPEKWLTS